MNPSPNPKPFPKIMNRLSLFRISFCLLFALVSLNCASHSNSPASDAKVLVPGDLVKVIVYGEQDLEQERKIPENGEVDFLLIGKVPLAGLTPEAATEKVKALYNKDFLVNPYLRLTVLLPGISASK
jgi:polysaccharide export outer membrane protein